MFKQKMMERQPKNKNSRNFNEDRDKEVDNQEEQNNNRKINMLSNSLERLSVYQPEPPERHPTKKEHESVTL